MIVRLVLLVVGVILVISKTESKTLPSYIQKCSLSDSEKFSKCALGVARKALPKLLAGDREYKLTKLNPFKIPELQLNGNGLNLTLSNLVITGIDTVQFNDIKYDKNSGKFTLDTSVEYLKIVSKYSVTGKVLVLPVVGNGNSVMNFKKCHLVFTIDIKPGNDGKLKLENENLEVDFGDAYFNLDNLFNGDKRLGDEINKFLNDNWKEIISEFKQLVLGPMRAVKKTFFTGILENLTLSEAFADV